VVLNKRGFTPNPQGHLTMSGDTSDCAAGAGSVTGVHWGEVRRLLGSVQSVSCAEAEKSCSSRTSPMVLSCWCISLFHMCIIHNCVRTWLSYLDLFIKHYVLIERVMVNLQNFVSHVSFLYHKCSNLLLL
jgi:hypothetical protein